MSVIPWGLPLYRPEGVEQADHVIDEHNRTHGCWSRQCLVARALKEIVEEAQNDRLYESRMTPGQREAIDMILTKISRIVCGNPHHPDHVLDIIGYARLFQRSSE